MKLYKKLVSAIAGLSLAMALVFVPVSAHVARADWNNQCDAWQLVMDGYVEQMIELQTAGYDAAVLMELDHLYASWYLTYQIMVDIGCFGY